MIASPQVELRNNMIIGRFIWRLVVSAALLSSFCGCNNVMASSWNDPSSSRRRPDPPAYRGKPPPRRENDGLYQVNVYDQGDGFNGDHPRPSAPLEHFDSSNNAPPEHLDSLSSSTFTPIHYQFRATDEEKRPMGKDLPTDVPLTELDRESMQERMDDDGREYASARSDVVTRFISTKKGRVMLTASSGAVGAALGSFLGKSLMNNSSPLNLVFSVLFIVCTVLRNAYGELSRALGMALILALQRTRNIRQQYPCWPHIKACLAAGPRMPTDYPLMQSVLSMALVGVVCGGNLPLLPTWMGALAGGASMAMITTLPTANGDLARSMGMRVVSLAQEVLEINSELRILPKLAVVSGKIFDRIMILDRKHRIKDKIVATVSWGYEQVTRTAQKVQEDEMGRDGDDGRGGDRRRGGDDRRGEPPRRGGNDRSGNGGRSFERERDGDRRDDRERRGDAWRNERRR